MIVFFYVELNYSKIWLNRDEGKVLEVSRILSKILRLEKNGMFV